MDSFREGLKEFYNLKYPILLDHYPGITLQRLIFEFEDFHIQDHAHFKKYLEALNLGIPLAYISEKCFFYNSIFKINRYALIPRYETELLVEIALSEISKNNFKTFCDVGVGPGTILFSVLRDSPISLESLGLDISEEVLNLANENLSLLRPKFKTNQIVALKKSDRLISINQKFDLIVSNPPYIKESDKKNVHQQVVDFEPHVALFIKDQEFEEWFKFFFDQVKKSLNINGVFLMEGHEDNLPDLGCIAQNYFSEIQIIQDLTHRNRFLKAKK